MEKRNKKSTQVEDCWRTVGVWSHAEEKCAELQQYIHCRNCPVFSKIGHSVFEKSAPSGYLSQWRKEISAQVEDDHTRPNSVLVFRVGNEWFALKAGVLSEIANEREIHRIPQNLNSFISGIVNINGEIKICYSLSELLGLKEYKINSESQSNHSPKRLVVIEFGEMQYVFLVDEVKGLHWYNDADVLPVPSILSVDNSLLLLGSIDQFNHQIAILNTNNLQVKLEEVAS